MKLGLWWSLEGSGQSSWFPMEGKALCVMPTVCAMAAWLSGLAGGNRHRSILCQGGHDDLKPFLPQSQGFLKCLWSQVHRFVMDALSRYSPSIFARTTLQALMF